MANCVTKFFTKTGTDFTETRGVVIAAKISDNVTWDFYSRDTFVAYRGGVPYIVGKWQCDGDENFIINGDVTKTDGTKKKQTFSSKTPDKWTDTVDSPTTQPNPIFDCIRNFHSDNKDYYGTKEKLYEYPDRLTITFRNKDNTLRAFSFYTNKRLIILNLNADNKWVAENKRGTWECLEERDYKFTEDSLPPATEEPTYDKSKFPLKVGSQGPEVVQLQNYLNKLIPFEPLVVNGIFDKKTQDKLTQLQKSLNITK